jgi:hypothetical protein
MTDEGRRKLKENIHDVGGEFLANQRRLDLIQKSQADSTRKIVGYIPDLGIDVASADFCMSIAFS